MYGIFLLIVIKKGMQKSDALLPTGRNKVKRVPKRGHYDFDTINKILDSDFVAHVGFVVDGQPFVIPTAYGRKEKKLYLHGATTSRMMVALQKGIPVCVTVTQIDGIVLARSAFNHSMNYHSVVVFGNAHLVEGEEKEEALLIISEQILKGRWDESRLPNERELKATTVLALDIEQASAKIRTGPPSDDKPDYKLPIWAGVIPMERTYLPPVADPKLRSGIALAPSTYHVNERQNVVTAPPHDPGRPAPVTSSKYFRKYINLVGEGPIIDHLKNNEYDMVRYFSNIKKENWLVSYAPGKWNLKETLLHIIDTERVMAYRALAIARGDQTPLPGYEQDDYAAVGETAHRTGDSLISEFRSVRRATISLFEGIKPEDYDRLGTASGYPASPLALGYIIAGHELHHLAILREKYEPLMS